MYTDAEAALPSAAEIREALPIGATAPDAYGPNVYFECTSPECRAVPGLRV